MEVVRGSRMSAVMPERWVLEGGGISTAMPEKSTAMPEKWDGWGEDVCMDGDVDGVRMRMSAVMPERLDSGWEWMG